MTPSGSQPTLAKRSAVFEKALGLYRSAAILLLNAIVLFFVVNVLLSLVFATHGCFFRQGRASEASLAAAYPDLGPAQRTALLNEFESNYYLIYEDYVCFKEHPFRGKYLNVSQAGFREIKNQGPWPPDLRNLNVFAFGGSTMYGEALPDHQSIPSCLQEELSAHLKRRVCVYNFGASSYYSTQERILLEQLLGKGLKPDIAIFLDGLNDLWLPHGSDTPWFQEEVNAAFALSRKITLSHLLHKLPLVRFARSIRARLMGQVDSISPATQEELRETIQRYRRNKVLAEAAYHAFGISSVFVWQPVPSYKCDATHNPFLDESYRREQQNQTAGYAMMEQVAKTGALGTNFLWCADLQKEESGCLYVDYCHYTAKFSRTIAAAITRMCFDRGLIKGAGLEASQPRGAGPAAAEAGSALK